MGSTIPPNGGVPGRHKVPPPDIGTQALLGVIGETST